MLVYGMKEVPAWLCKRGERTNLATRLGKSDPTACDGGRTMTIAQERAATTESSLDGLSHDLLIEMYSRMWQARRGVATCVGTASGRRHPPLSAQ